MKGITVYNTIKKSISSYLAIIKMNTWLLSLVFILFFAGEGIGQIVQKGDATTGAYSGTVSGTVTFTIDKPTGIVSGDVMFAMIAQNINGTAPTDAAIAGWTIVKSYTDNSKVRVNLLYKIADGTEGSSFTVTIYDNAGNRGPTSGVIVGFSGVNSTGGVGLSGSGSGPFDVAVPSFSTTSTSSLATAASITTSSNGAAVIMFLGSAFDGGTLSGWTTTSAGTLMEIADIHQ